MRAAVSYIRVSKPKQGRSGLGLEAQQAAIRSFCTQHGFNIEAEYREVETGKGADALERRPELAAAMKYARKLGRGGKAGAAPIIIAKLDRLSRDVHFISGLMVQRIPFITPRWPRKSASASLNVPEKLSQPPRLAARCSAMPQSGKPARPKRTCTPSISGPLSSRYATSPPSASPRS